MTNFERIKTMSVEEMAGVFEMCEFFAVAMNGTHDERHKPALLWLESEVEEDEDN